MAGKLSFSIAINLLTEQFKRGANQVKATFKALQMQILTFVAALGAGGIGLSNLVSRFVDVARETNRVTTALKNVSGGLAKYADNQRYLLDMAKKYGLEINALTGNFAKLTAAASVSGMTMQEQKKIFESVSRAVTAFGMSADDSNGVFLALSQMVSKGKISSEELRLQMGERLPIALQAMAKAAGTSVAGLDKLLKQGKLMSKDVLPKFAEALNEMIPNIDLDNLETSINRLKNTFTEVVNSTGVQSTYKSLVDWLAKTIASAAENTVNIVIGTLALITGAIANHAVKWWTSISSTTSMIEANVAKTNTLLVQATQQRIAAEVALEQAKTQSVMAEANARVALDKALQKEKMASDQVAYAEQKAADAKKIVEAQTTARAMLKATRERVAAEITLEATKAEVIAAQNASLQAQTYNDAIAARERLAIAQKNFASAETTLAQKTAKEVAAAEAAKAAAAEAAAVKSQSVWGRFCNVTKVAVGKLVVQIKAMWAAFKPMIIVTAITAVIGKLVAMYKEAKRIKRIFSDYKEAAKGIQSSTEIAQLEALRNIVNDVKRSENERKKALEEISKRLNIIQKKNESEIDYQKRINDKIKDRIKLLEESARADFYAQQKVSAEHEFNKIKNTLGLQGMLDGNMESMMSNMARYKDTGSRKALQKGINVYAEQIRGSGGKFTDNYQDKLVEMSNYWQIMVDSSKEIANAVNNSLKLNTNNTDVDTEKEKQTPLQKAEEEYRTSLQNYKNQLESGAITQNKYNEEIDKLNSDTVVKLGGILGKSADANEIYVSALLGTLNPRVTESAKAQAELAKVQKEYQTSVSLAKVKLDKKLISEDEYRQAIIDAALAAANSAVSIEKIGDAADNFVKEMQGVIGENLQKNFQRPKLRQRDTTFDYKKTETDKLSEKVDIWIEYRDNLKEKLNGVKAKTSDLAKEIQTELNSAIQNTNDFEKALKIAQVRQDVKDFSKELNESLYSGVKNIASSSDRMVNAFENLRDVMNDVDASGWERIMAVWNAMTNTIDGIMSICKTIETLTELTNKLAKAKEKEEEIDKRKIVIDNLTTNTKITNDVKEVVSDTTTAEAKKNNSKGVIAANTTEAATGAAKSVAGIPIVGLALAAGAVAAIIGLFASLPKFARGGVITGGPSSGDKILARVNAGEMILNSGQQSRLFEAINSGQLGGGKTLSSTVTTKVRSKDLILTINNELKSQGKKPIS